MRNRRSLLFFFAVVTAACGTDVDVGGISDAALSDASGAGLPCEPCAATSECQSGSTCGQFAGDNFCAIACPNPSDCAQDETCTSIVTTSGARVDACVPTNGSCPPSAPPLVPDGGAADQCGTLNGPTVPSQCHSCGRFSNDCQPNGCYGGWWCNTVTRQCQRPPRSCP